MEPSSKRFSLDAHDWKKIAKGTLIAAAGSALTFAGPALLGLTYAIDVGGRPVDLTPIVIVIVSSAINAAQKWLQDHADRDGAGTDSEPRQE